MRTVLTIGTFDVPHLGHAFLLRECERYGDRVIVGVNSDAFVTEYKGQAPIFDWKERSRFVLALGYQVEPNNSPGRNLIEAIRPNVLAIGSDWATRDYYSQINVNQGYLDERRITMVYIPRVPHLSSSEIRQRCR